jgi:hypothetical protein
MEEISGFARVIARVRVNQQLNKPFFGKPYLKVGQGLALGGYFFQLGGILGVKHRTNLDAFGHAFLGLTGESGAVLRLFTKVAPSVSDAMTFGDYVSADFSQRAGHNGNPARLLVEHGMDKIRADTAFELAYQYAVYGAALGATSPNTLRRIFERSNVVVPKEEWDAARTAGLDIPAEQDVTSYEEIEEGEDRYFMAYCQKCCPDFYAILSA